MSSGDGACVYVCVLNSVCVCGVCKKAKDKLEP